MRTYENIYERADEAQEKKETKEMFDRRWDLTSYWKSVVIKWCIIAAIALLFIIIICKSWFIVEPWYEWFTVTLWKINQTVYSDWLHLKTPFITKSVKYNIQTQKLDAKADASSKDLQNVAASIVVNYKYKESEVVKLYKNVWKEEKVAEKIITPAVQEVFKAVVAKYSAEQLITERSAVSKDIEENLNKRLQAYWVEIQLFNIVNFDFSKSFNDAIEAKVTAEQEALAEKNKLEKVKYESDQKIVAAEAQAKAIEIQAKAIQNQWGAEYVKLKWIEKWNWQLPTTMAWDADLLIMK
jgi:regulator of protease activity HflC (stomatin/prohibitin superfamily)